MIEIKPIVDSINFVPRIGFYKNDKLVNSFSVEILDDLTFISPPNNPFRGPQLTIEDAVLELITIVKNDSEEFSDITTEDFVKLFEPFIQNKKVKVWNGDYLPFTKD